MVDVTPYYELEEVDCRWEIKGFKTVSGEDLEAALIAYFDEQERLGNK